MGLKPRQAKLCGEKIMAGKKCMNSKHNIIFSSNFSHKTIWQAFEVTLADRKILAGTSWALLI